MPDFLRRGRSRDWMTAVLIASALAVAAPAAAEVSPWYETITLHGFASGSFLYNLNAPPGLANAYRVFDTGSNAFRLDVAQLSIQRLPEKPGEAGLRLDFVGGHSIPPVVAGDPDRLVDLHQGFVSWIAPVGRGLKVDLGKFYTHLGSEVIEGVDGWNEQYSRSFLFGYSIPFLHTGVRASLPISDRLSALVCVVNGWDNHIENNRSKSIGAQVAAVPVDRLSLTGNFIFGPELPGVDSENRWVLDAVAGLQLAPRIKLGVNYDLGREERSDPFDDDDDDFGDSFDWTGVAGYLRYELASRAALNLRGEIFDDKDGYRTGFGAPLRLTEVTVSPEYRVTESMVIRGEFRLDSADEKAFPARSDGRTRMKKTQPTVAVNWVCRF